MLRNLVTSLLEHEQIKTTLPKARDTARLAEKIITLGKWGDGNAYSRASSFVLKRSVLPKLFGTFAERYAERPGGYTRIHKFGRRQGDNAPHAILELVDNPKDLRYEITARTVGWELLRENLKTEQPISLINNGIDGAEELIEQEKHLQRGAEGKLREKTRWNLQKVLRYRDPSASLDFAQKAGDYIDTLLARPLLLKSKLDSSDAPTSNAVFQRENFSRGWRAGQAVPGETRGAVRLARSALARPRRWEPKTPRFVVDTQPLW